MQQALAMLPELAGQLSHSVRLSAPHWMQETQEHWEQLAVQEQPAAQQELGLLAPALSMRAYWQLSPLRRSPRASGNLPTCYREAPYKLLHLLLVRVQDLVGTIVSLTHDARHLFVDTTRCFL